jgi:hypothetical protein
VLLVDVPHVSEVSNASAGAGVMVLAQTLPVGSHPITLLHVVDSEAQEVLLVSATQSVLQELIVAVVHSSEFGSTLLGSLESVKSASS